MKLIRGFLALALLVSGLLMSFHAAKWLQAAIGLPSLVVLSRRGTATDVVHLAVTLSFFIGYLHVVPKLLRIDHSELSRMLRGE